MLTKVERWVLKRKNKSGNLVQQVREFGPAKEMPRSCRNRSSATMLSLQGQAPFWAWEAQKLEPRQECQGHKLVQGQAMETSWGASSK